MTASCSAWDSVKEIVGKVWLYVIIGIAVGAGIHGYVPADALAAILGKQAWWSVPAAVLLGIPLYSNAAGMIPIVGVLIEKGAPLGTALAFMMSVIGLSLPEAVILRRVLKDAVAGHFLCRDCSCHHPHRLSIQYHFVTGENMLTIKVLGSGCANCKRVEAIARTGSREYGSGGGDDQSDRLR